MTNVYLALYPHQGQFLKIACLFWKNKLINLYRHIYYVFQLLVKLMMGQKLL